MAAQTEVDICNLALDHLNITPITTITNPTDKVGKVCERWYDNTRKSALRKHTWNFAQKRAALAQLATDPLWGYNAQYELPSDYIRIVEIGDLNQYKDYAIEGTKLLLDETNTGSLNIRYIYDNKSVETFDPLFVELLSLELAYNMAFPLAGNINLQRSIQILRDDKRREAFGVDGQERPPRRRERSRFKEARMKYGNYGSPFIED